jgi:hypothetical protein
MDRVFSFLSDATLLAISPIALVVVYFLASRVLRTSLSLGEKRSGADITIARPPSPPGSRPPAPVGPSEPVPPAPAGAPAELPDVRGTQRRWYRRRGFARIDEAAPGYRPLDVDIGGEVAPEENQQSQQQRPQAQVQEPRQRARQAPPARPDAADHEAGRYLNLAFQRAGTEQVVPWQESLQANSPDYELRINIGPLLLDRIPDGRPQATPSIFPDPALPPAEEGHWLDVVTASRDFLVSLRAKAGCFYRWADRVGFVIAIRGSCIAVHWTRANNSFAFR